MGNVNMEAKQVHVRNNSHKTWHTVADAVAALDKQDDMVQEDITELYTRDASRASKDNIAGEFSEEQVYRAGDFAYYQGSLFKFTAFHAAGAWNPEDVEITMVTNELGGALPVYSTTGIPAGVWIDGRTMYRKVVNLGALPNNTTKLVNLGVPSGYAPLFFLAFGADATGSVKTLPFVDDYSKSADLLCDIMPDAQDGFNMRLITSYDRSDYTGTCILYYAEVTV